LSLLHESSVIRSVLLFVILDHVEVNTETEGTVDELTHNGNFKYFIELFCATGGLDLASDREWGSRASTLRAELNAYLDHVHRLNAIGGSTGGEGAGQKVFVKIARYKG
jgi:hypothetical protein